MFLGRLVVEGFKSYSTRVEVNFSPQLSVIIGSNGVGKSNALEAVVWALGEDDPAALRIDGSEDLLFAGSGETPPAETAVVTLGFEHEGEETTVTRSVGRSGTETFSVRGQAIKDLWEYRAALEDLGVGAVRQSLIRQEQLTDFFAGSSATRRDYLDRFLTTEVALDRINSAFSSYMDALIPGSEAGIVNGKTDSGNPDIEVVFPGKGLKRGVLLSGGERAVVSLALKLALFDTIAGPVYLLDEIEPSLDWTRNNNMQNLLKNVSRSRQLIMITHVQSTIQMAKTVHGVRIRPDGSSWLKFHFVMDERLFKIYKCC